MRYFLRTLQIKLVIFLACLFCSSAAPLNKPEIEKHFGGKIIQNFGDPNFTNPKIRTKRLFVALSVGTRIRSLTGGIVEHAGWLEGFPTGLSIKIRVKNELFLIYSCLSGISVKVGEHIQPGQILALSNGGGDTCAPAPGVGIFLIEKGEFKDPLLL